MAITLTPISKSSTVSPSLVSKSTSGVGIVTGNPIGLLLALTYSADISAGGLGVTLISKN